MRSRMMLGFLVAVSSATILCPDRYVAGQQSGEPGPYYVYGQSGTSSVAGRPMDPLVAEDLELEKLIDEAIQGFTAAKTDEERTAARQKITELVTKQFALRQQRREKEIAEIEERVKRLRDALEKRAEAKQTIVERRLNQLLSEAEGLGWGEVGEAGGPGARYSRPGAMYGGTYGSTSAAPSAPGGRTGGRGGVSRQSGSGSGFIVPVGPPPSRTVPLKDKSE